MSVGKDFSLTGAQQQNTLATDQTGDMTMKSQTTVLTLAGNEHMLKSNTKSVPYSPDFDFGDIPENTLVDGSDTMSVATSVLDDEIPPQREIQNKTGKDGLQVFKDHKVSLVRGKGAFIGAGVGLLGGGAVGALKLAAIGAAIGTMVMPGIGTAVGAVVGGLVGIVGGALIGGGTGAGIGHLVGKSDAAKIDVESLVEKYGPDSQQYDKLLDSVGIDTKTRYPRDDTLIGDAFRDALQNRVDAGRPFGPRFISATLLALRKINYDQRLDLRDDQSAANNAFLRQLNVPGRDTPAMIEATTDALLDIFTAEDLESGQKQDVANRLVEQFERQANIGKSVSPLETQRLAEKYLNEARST
jgi:hypothetical protein